MARNDEREVVYVERDGGSIRPILLGALLGLAAGLLFAPQSGDETRRQLKRRLRKARALAEEKIGELSERVNGEFRRPAASDPEESREESREERRDVVRTELERRLADARARRRAPVAMDLDEDEEPVA